MAESQLGEGLRDDETARIAASVDSLMGELLEVISPFLPAETATTPRPSAEVLP